MKDAPTPAPLNGRPGCEKSVRDPAQPRSPNTISRNADLAGAELGAGHPERITDRGARSLTAHRLHTAEEKLLLNGKRIRLTCPRRA